jgi:large subunit ribosomal protein L33
LYKFALHTIATGNRAGYRARRGGTNSREISMAKGKAKNQELVALQCSECDRRNYTTTKNRKNTQGKLEFSKYCRWDRKHTLHKEVKVK